MKKSQIVIWLAALAIGVALGFIHSSTLDAIMNFIATVFTRLFRLLAVPTIILAVITTLASLGGSREMGKMFRIALASTLSTTFAAAAVGLGYYLLIRRGSLPQTALAAENPMADQAEKFSYT
ncbi:MAG: cation:dicarboxylase symporter family transporter, partial [Duncaniella sp.]|nr:cation:dicarboxylase symporter family transporter [Duncaniella sp.]